jgi:hypothetical protein
MENQLSIPSVKSAQQRDISPIAQSFLLEVARKFRKVPNSLEQTIGGVTPVWYHASAPAHAIAWRTGLTTAIELLRQLHVGELPEQQAGQKLRGVYAALGGKNDFADQYASLKTWDIGQK